MVFCNNYKDILEIDGNDVTILILIDGFLQWIGDVGLSPFYRSHNPYFNRWFSAITDDLIFKSLNEGHNPYFNRWFSAIKR